MRARGSWMALVFVACATDPSPTPTPEAPPAEAPAPSPGPAPSPEPAPSPSPAPAVTPAPELGPEPNLELSDEQLARARKVQPIVREAAMKYSFDPNLLNGIIWAESKFNPKARNRSGARGLMQLMPKTSKAMAKRLGRPHRPYDPSFSIHAGAHLLATLRDRFDGDVELALFGYARGGGRVRTYLREGGEIPQGVQDFIARVRRGQRTFAALGFPDAA